MVCDSGDSSHMVRETCGNTWEEEAYCSSALIIHGKALNDDPF
jgi:hypothetical protein